STVVLTFLICSLAIGGAVFLIFEMDRPLGGVMQILSWPLREVLPYMKCWPRQGPRQQAAAIPIAVRDVRCMAHLRVLGAWFGPTRLVYTPQRAGAAYGAASFSSAPDRGCASDRASTRRVRPW